MARNLLAIAGIAFIIFGAYSMATDGEMHNFIFVTGGIVFLFLAYQNHLKNSVISAEDSNDAG
ncbi:hypothetical protein FGU71_12160 [Erythrobacter insulae]|uniref:Uncharacterized protein n=1 Tax=Erythrobacter insulae TaxID=2584124 RepID=A0A547PEH3_9SPHN|nr:hypothetical protein [Erythrobacter insulae]TRD12542.1 hypothetical protein FGU71_12160 [Erythrobacter insulae]